MDLLNSFVTGGILDWFLATPYAKGFLAFALSVVAIATPLQAILRAAKKLAGLTTTDVDDLWVGRFQIVVDRVLVAARGVVTGDSDMFAMLGAIFKPITRNRALNFEEHAQARK